jgi:hypothetical protein
VNAVFESDASERLRSCILALQATYRECGQSSVRRMSLTCDESEAIVTRECETCLQTESLTFDASGLKFRRCPFCDGPLLLAGYSCFALDGSTLGSMCYRCRAKIQRNRGRFGHLRSLPPGHKGPTLLNAACGSEGGGVS